VKLATYVLACFPVRARAEHIRLLLEDLKLPCEMESIPKEAVTQPKILPNYLSFGQVKVLKYGNWVLAQSGASARFLARK